MATKKKKTNKKPLIIVESPAKSKTIEKITNYRYKVKASMGHIMDLPKSKLGVDIENNFEPKYIKIRGKKQILDELKKSVKDAKDIYLATDPDREGEAIAWHLIKTLKLPEETKRIRLREITKEGINQALKQVDKVDLKKVQAQQARRVLDRLVGYNLSPFLWKTIQKGLSAGRVQSVALKIICDREQEIKNFKPQEYWYIYTYLYKTKNNNIKFQLTKYKNKKIDIKNKNEAEKIEKELKQANYVIKEIKIKENKKAPPPPFITSTLQQSAFLKLKFSVSKTMKIAQQLYEGIDINKKRIGLITYMRTDSVRISDTALKNAKNFIENMYGKNYYKKHIFHTKKSAQDAHEAIRPTYIEKTPDQIKEFLTKDQYNLYKLIWQRFTASQMSDAIIENTTILVNANDYTLKANFKKLIFDGYTKILNDLNLNEFINLKENLKEAEKLNLNKIEKKQNFTKPLPRFTEASLVKFLEDKNIGRPSTYATIISTITKRGYVEKQENKLKPTELGITVNNLLQKYFKDIINIIFTAKMEENLDKIEEGKLNYIDVIKSFYPDFKQYLDKVLQKAEKVKLKPEYIDEKCPVCSKPLVIKTGRFGKFIACSGFPDCRYTRPFYQKIGIKCPLDGGDIVIAKTKKGRIYYKCINTPNCNFMTWQKPTGKLCPECKSPLVYKNEKTIICSNKECKYKESVKI